MLWIVVPSTLSLSVRLNGYLIVMDFAGVPINDDDMCCFFFGTGSLFKNDTLKNIKIGMAFSVNDSWMNNKRSRRSRIRACMCRCCDRLNWWYVVRTHKIPPCTNPQ